MNRDEIMKLTLEQLNIEIAKKIEPSVPIESRYCEYDPEDGSIFESESFRLYYGQKISEDMFKYPCYVHSHEIDKYGQSADFDPITNYAENLVEAYKLVGDIPESGRDYYNSVLWYLIAGNDTLYKHLFELFQATAEQRSRAWLIWKEER